MKKFLITAALPYANGPLHFGHIAGAYLPADCYARYQRLQGHDVLYVCASDEFGVAITLSADMAKRSPKEHVEIFHQINKQFFEILNISFDHYSRTSIPGHVPVVQQFFLDLYKNGFVEEKEKEHLYSEKDQKFLADRYVVGTCPKCGFDKARGDECPKCGASYEAINLIHPRSKLTSNPLQKRLSRHWYMRFDMFKERLSQWLEKKNWKSNVTQFTLNYLKDLHPRAVTRDATWGVPVPLPNTEGKVLYVWFDAPIGYITATMDWAESIGQPNEWKKYWLDANTKYIQFLGKDNIPFHTLFFPAMIMGQNVPYKLVDDVPANEFLLFEGKQFSKSEGWTIDLEVFFKEFSVDQIRYYLAAIAPETSDSEFIWKDFQIKCNSELLAKLGNFVNRTLIFIKNNCSKKIPTCHDLETVDKQFIQEMNKKIDQAAESYEQYHLRQATHIIMELAQLANSYFDSKKPWVLVKDKRTKPIMENTMHLCVKCIKTLCLISFPIIPTTAQEMWRMIGQDGELSSQNWLKIKEETSFDKQKIKDPKILFRKIEDEEIQKKMDELHKNEKKEETNSVISFKDFEKIQMRVGEILEAEKIEKSKKLLKLQVDIGTGKRQIVSGIAQKYSSEELIGKKVIVLTNLKPVKLMGIESQGMILAAGEDDSLEIPFIQNQKPGSIVC